MRPTRLIMRRPEHDSLLTWCISAQALTIQSSHDLVLRNISVLQFNDCIVGITRWMILSVWCFPSRAATTKKKARRGSSSTRHNMRNSLDGTAPRREPVNETDHEMLRIL